MASAIRTRFKTEIADEYSLEVLYDNAPGDDPSASASLTMGLWIRFSVLPGDSDCQEFGGSKTSRTPGVAVAQIFAQLRQGDRNSLQVADYIKSAFRHVSADGVIYGTPYVRTVGRDNKWYQINVFCPFYSDDIS